MRRESYSNRFATALDGVDMDNHGTALDRSGEPVPVPRVVGEISRRHAVQVRDVEFLREHTGQGDQDHRARPLHHGQQAQDDFYGDPEALALAYAGAVNEEIKDLFAAGCRRGPARRALHAGAAGQGAGLWAEGARAGAGRRRGHHRAAHLLRLCAPDPRAARGLQLPARTGGQRRAADLDRDRAVEPRYGGAGELPGKTIILGVLDLSTHEVETPETVAERIRRALPHVPSGKDHRGPGLRAQVPPARSRLRQDEGHGRRARRSCGRSSRELSGPPTPAACRARTTCST
jgi:5-methyltetrahydropteroyltriglutamate--homocysteine methyltransferase